MTLLHSYSWRLALTVSALLLLLLRRRRRLQLRWRLQQLLRPL
jgi:hypothetical protein